ncbi:MAG: methionyl-tRNA formyltransferase, partial [Myxococcales bacterium]|nr:methionyl-tRNA formyltransferase [Myxococcales bacterium]
MPLTEARILYFGDPQGALALLDRGVPLVGVVHGRPGGPGWQALVPRVRHLPRWFKPDLEAPEVVAALAALKPTLLVSGFYPRRIPPPVLALAPGVNVHPSDLPRWRGPDPAWWAIREGDAHT